MAQRADEAFGVMAPEYDSIAQRGMPRYEEMLDAVAGWLPDGARDVLELGCGTGALTLRLARRYPGAALRAVDAAPEMLDLAQRRLAAAGVEDGVTLEAALFESLPLPVHGYDVVTSNMSLHHIAYKMPFYAKLRVALRPGGLLVFGDELVGAFPYVEDRHWNGWLDYARRPGGLSEDEIGEIVKHVQELDHYETLERQLSLLRAAGFSAVDCVWRYLNYAVFIAQP